MLKIIGCKKLSFSVLFTRFYSRFTLSYYAYFAVYFPMQKREKMEPKISSVVICPVISPR